MSVNSAPTIQSTLALEGKEATSRSLIENAFKAIEEKDSEYNSVIRLRKDKALEEADKADQSRKSGHKLGRLHGVPFLIKDNMAIEGQEVNGCSKILESFTPTYTSTAVKRLKDEGPSLSDNATWMNLPWAHQQKRVFLVQQKTLGTLKE